MADSSADSVKIGPWVRAFRVIAPVSMTTDSRNTSITDVPEAGVYF